MNSSIKASQAYASITSQLQHWEDDENMEDGETYDMGLVSKRRSGAFSPMAGAGVASPKPNTNINTNNNMNGMTPATVKKSPRALSSTASKFSFATSPVATPMDIRAGTGAAGRHEMDYDYGGRAGMDATNATSTNTNNINSGRSMASFVNQASLDGDYRPYHDALLSLQSKSKAQSPKAALQYIHRIMASAYSRSSQLQDVGNSNSNSNSSINNNSNKKGNKEQVETSKLQLEQEGHFWALIGQLASSASGSSSGSMLLYQPPSASAVQREIDSFIANIVKEYQHLDPAGMATLIQQALEQEQDGDDSEIDSASSLPMTVKRRQVILKWIQSCHGRSVSNQDLTVGNKENSIMWKDTVDKFNREQHSFMGAENAGNHGKIDVFHPDAPLLSSGGNGKGNANGNPLYGKDNDREMILLQKCLLLIKAGRMVEMFELCHAAGQPWRVAAWDGDVPHGYIRAVREESGDDDEMEDVNDIARVGNPQKALWKRNMWEVSQSLHKMIQQNDQGGVSNSSTVSSGSMVYEAAISAILADDSKNASKNPLLNRNWMDSVWVFYRGLQSRFNDLVYTMHNNVRRSVANGTQISQSIGFGSSALKTEIAKYPVEGAGFKKEEEEQLKCTAEMSRIEEGAFISRLASNRSAQMHSDWERGINAFLTSGANIESYLKNTIDTLIEVASQSGQVKMSQEDFEPMLRFMLHLILFFDSFCDGNDARTTKFYSTSIAPNRNNLILAYLQQLMEQKPLWGFTGLYASLLPDDSLIDSCTDFWSTCVFDEKNRRIVLKNARDYFDEGMDLVILRNVVRSSIQSVDEFYDPLNVASWLGRATTNECFDEELECMISHDDVRKMHSIRWLSFYPEHSTEALICANMLTRNLLLELPGSTGEAIDDQFDDWTNNPKLYTAKVLQARFLPTNIVQVAMGSASNDEHQDDRDYVSMCTVEHEALLRFLDAHNAYEIWKDFFIENPSNIPFALGDRFLENSIESDVAIKMETMKYVKKKKEIGLTLIKFTKIAMESLMHVLEFGGGWLYVEESEGVNEVADEYSERRREMIDVRSKCLPAALSLAFRICHTTALWMEEFTRDVEDVHQNKATEVMTRITGNGMFEADGVSNLFEAATWHNEALLLANTVASRESKIAECMSKKDLDAFMNCMAETNICLLMAQESKR